MKVIIVSGGFDPIHSGHIEYFKAAKELGNKLIVALNSDSLSLVKILSAIFIFSAVFLVSIPSKKVITN